MLKPSAMLCPPPLRHAACSAVVWMADLGHTLAMDKIAEYAALDALIKRLNNHVPYTDADKAKLEPHRRSWLITAAARMFKTGETIGKASGDLEIFNQSETDFRAEIQRTDNDLGIQIERFNHGLDRWFEYAYHHPPYYPWRIAVILSKRKERDREMRFLAAYCRHFWSMKGARYEMILARAEKKGAFDRFSRG